MPSTTIQRSHRSCVTNTNGSSVIWSNVWKWTWPFWISITHVWTRTCAYWWTNRCVSSNFDPPTFRWSTRASIRWPWNSSCSLMVGHTWRWDLHSCRTPALSASESVLSEDVLVSFRSATDDEWRSLLRTRARGSLRIDRLWQLWTVLSSIRSVPSTEQIRGRV